MSAWPVEDETPGGSRVIGVVVRGAQDEWHAHRNGHHVGVFRTKAEAVQRLKDLTPPVTETHLTPYTGRIRHLDDDRGHPVCVTLDELEAQHENRWRDFHPERFCHRCGNANVDWATSPETWDPVMRPDERWWWHEIVCIPCFIELAERHHGPSCWRVTRDPHTGIEWLSEIKEDGQ